VAFVGYFAEFVSALADDRSASAVCRASEAIVRSWPSHSRTGEGNILVPDPDRAMVTELRRRDLEKAGWYGQAPSAALIAEFLRAPGGDVLAVCPNVRRTAESLGWKVGPKAADAALAERDPRGFPALVRRETIYALGLPVLSADGRAALVIVSLGCGPLCGTTSLEYRLRSRRGVWARISVVMIGIS
jgi:hypothetical protein